MAISEDWFFWSHRRALAVAARDAGYSVTVATPVGEHGDAIRGLGLDLVPLVAMRRRSRSPVAEGRALRELMTVYRRVRPDIVHHVTIKPVLYGTIAARLTGVPAIVNGIYGLGHVFSGAGAKAALTRSLVTAAYRGAFAVARRRQRVTFENADDRDRFVATRICTPAETVVIRGMGYDPTAFSPQPIPRGEPVVMMAGRLLWSKGVGDLVASVRLLRARGTRCRLVIVGAPDHDNPRAVPEDVLRAWNEEGVAEWWGRRADMPAVLAQASIVALPSTYGEGLPKVLIEAAGVGRALVATDIPGCRDIVRPGINGVLVPPGDVAALALALETLLQAPQVMAEFGRRGHELAASEFSDAVVNAATLRVYGDLLRSIPA